MFIFNGSKAQPVVAADAGAILAPPEPAPVVPDGPAPVGQQAPASSGQRQYVAVEDPNKPAFEFKVIPDIKFEKKNRISNIQYF